MNSKYYYEYEWDSTYCYPNSHVLKNKLNITNQAELEAAERAITSVKSTQLRENVSRRQRLNIYYENVFYRSDKENL